MAKRKTDGGMPSSASTGSEDATPPKIIFRKLGDLCDFTKGEIGIVKATPGKYPLVVTAAGRKTCASYQFDAEAVCIPLVSSAGHGKKKLNNVHYQTGKFALGTILVAVIPKDEKILSTRFLHLYLSHLKDLILVPLMRGAANVSLSVGAIKDVEIPLPSIEDQAFLISRFENIDSEQQELIDEITEQGALLKKLRQSILQDAIQGKLTADWRKAHPDTEPAADLLQRIQTEKQKLIAAKKTRKQKPLPPINPEEIPFKIPMDWEWCRYGDICEYITSGSRGWQKYYAKEGALFIRAQNIKTDELVLNDKAYVKLPSKVEGKRALVQLGDILVTITGGNVGKTALVRERLEEAYISQHIALTRLMETSSAQYLFLNFMSDAGARGQLIKFVKGAKPGLTLENIQTLHIPLPPLAEQEAIVAQVETLFGMVDEMEQQTTRSRTDATALMASVLAAAFAPS